MTNQHLAAGILAAVALVAYLVGRAIRGGAVWLVAGYRPDRVSDPAALARNMGGFVLLLAAVIFVAAVAAAAPLLGVNASTFGRWLGGAVGVALVVLLAREARRDLRPTKR